MKLLALACFFFTVSYLAYSAAAPQTFPTSAGEVKITPLYHASTLIEAGGKTIYSTRPNLQSSRGPRRRTSF